MDMFDSLLGGKGGSDATSAEELQQVMQSLGGGGGGPAGSGDGNGQQGASSGGGGGGGAGAGAGAGPGSVGGAQGGPANGGAAGRGMPHGPGRGGGFPASQGRAGAHAGQGGYPRMPPGVRAPGQGGFSMDPLKARLGQAGMGGQLSSLAGFGAGLMGSSLGGGRGGSSLGAAVPGRTYAQLNAAALGKGGAAGGLGQAPRMQAYGVPAGGQKVMAAQAAQQRQGVASAAQNLIRFMEAMKLQVQNSSLPPEKKQQLVTLNNHFKEKVGSADDPKRLCREYYVKLTEVVGSEYMRKLQQMHTAASQRRQAMAAAAAAAAKAGVSGASPAAGGSSTSSAAGFQGMAAQASLAAQSVGKKRDRNATAATTGSGSSSPIPPAKRSKKKDKKKESGTKVGDLTDVTKQAGIDLSSERERTFSKEKTKEKKKKKKDEKPKEREVRMEMPSAVPLQATPLPNAVSRDIGLLRYMPLRERVLDHLHAHQINSVTEEVLDLLSAATEHRLRGILEEMVKISKVRVDESKQAFPFAVSSDPRRILRQVERKERKEREDKKRRELEEKQKSEMEKDPKAERKKLEMEAKLTNRTALDAVGSVRKRATFTGFGGLDATPSFRKSSSSGLKSSTDTAATPDSPRPVIALPPSSIQAPEAKYKNRRLTYADMLAYFESDPRPLPPRMYQWGLRVDAHRKATSRERPMPLSSS